MNKLLRFIPALIVMSIIFYSSSQPYGEQDMRGSIEKSLPVDWIKSTFDTVSFSYAQSEVSIDALGVGGFVEFFLRKGAHFGIYFVLAATLSYGFVGVVRNKWNVALIAWIGTVLYAISDEYHQSLTVDRTPLIQDVIIDSVGALVAVVLFLILFPLFSKRRT